MKTALRIFVIAIVTVSSAAWLLLSATAQKRRNEFFHSTAAHKRINCASCHKTPTANSVSVRGFPDVADYPGHSSCVRCHRTDFFQGNNPEICTICHTASSPRNSRRFPFPIRSRSSEFKTRFPHDAHQDIIARNERHDGTIPAHLVLAYRGLPGGSSEDILSSEGQQDTAATAGSMPALHSVDTVPAHFVNASFTPAAFPADDPTPTPTPTPQFNNCAICHQTSAVLPKFDNPTPVHEQALAPASVDNFAPSPEFFKSSPEGHTSCFSCHYQGQKPVSTDCAGCHRQVAPYFGPDVKIRYSLRFNHNGGGTNKMHIRDCTVCHVRITQNSDLSTMREADVPFASCSTSSCHGPHLTAEIDKRAGTILKKEPVYQCFYCHTREIGRFEIPANHVPR